MLIKFKRLRSHIIVVAFYKKLQVGELSR